MACESNNPFLVLENSASFELARDLALLTLASTIPSTVLDLAKALSGKHVRHMVLILEGRSFLGVVRPAAREYLRHVL